MIFLHSLLLACSFTSAFALDALQLPNATQGLTAQNNTLIGQLPICLEPFKNRPLWDDCFGLPEIMMSSHIEAIANQRGTFNYDRQLDDDFRLPYIMSNNTCVLSVKLVNGPETSSWGEIYTKLTDMQLGCQECRPGSTKCFGPPPQVSRTGGTIYAGDHNGIKIRLTTWALLAPAALGGGNNTVADS